MKELFEKCEPVDKSAEGDAIKEMIATKHGFMGGFTVHSNPTLAKRNLYAAMEEYASIVERRSCEKCAMAWTKQPSPVESSAEEIPSEIVTKMQKEFQPETIRDFEQGMYSGYGFGLQDGFKYAQSQRVEREVGDSKPQKYEPYFGWCDVSGCKNEACSGGIAWREKGYWRVCSKHSTSYRDGNSQPKMKQTAIKREKSRDKTTGFFLIV